MAYAKPPFGGREQVLDYVGRYTHRVAISNNRVIDIEDGAVRFRWKDYRHGNRQKDMTLSAEEFIRRFLLHVLPVGFHRIRYYGFLGNGHRAQKPAHCRDLLGMPLAELSVDPSEKDYRDRCEDLTEHSLRESPACHQGQMIIIEIFDGGTGPPPYRDTSWRSAPLSSSPHRTGRSAGSRAEPAKVCAIAPAQPSRQGAAPVLAGFVELAKSTIGISLQNTDIRGEMALRVFAFSVA